LSLFQLVQEHRKGIAFVAILILIENIACVVDPTLFGNLIDAFLKRAEMKIPVDRYAHNIPLIF
jgi:hypothetical protein